MISIITINLNDLRGLKTTANSIFSQDCSEWEWVVVDGLSSDGSVEWIRGIACKEFRVKWVSEKDRGIYDAMNKGLGIAQRKYAIFMNAGDYFAAPDVIRVVINELNNCKKSPVILYGECMIEKDIEVRVLRRYRASRDMPYTMPASHQAIFFPVDAIKSIGYDASYKIKGDYALYAELYMRKMPIIRIKKTICIFSFGGFSSQSPWLALREHLRVQRSILKCRWLYRFESGAKLLMSMVVRRLLLKVATIKKVLSWRDV